MILSIIIPMYNVERYIGRCLQSLCLQDISSDNFEIIVVNDGSKDNSLMIAKSYENKLCNLHIISRPNGGLSAARNTGIENAKGKYYFFLDSDDWIAENSLSKIAAKLQRETPDVLCICKCRSNGKDHYGHTSFKSEDSMVGVDAFLMGLDPMAQLSIVNAEFFQRNSLKFYEGIYHEDSELIPRVHCLASKISFLNGTIYYYYVNDNSIMTKPNPKKAYDLIRVVCPSLISFSSTLDKECRHAFYNIISMYINNAFVAISACDQSVQKEFNEYLYQNRSILVHLSKSSHFKYRLEYRLFKIFPKYYVQIYDFLRHIGKH